MDMFYWINFPDSDLHGLKVKHIKDLINNESLIETINGTRYIVSDDCLFYDHAGLQCTIKRGTKPPRHNSHR